LKIEYILDRIFTFNQSCDNPHQRWQIAFPPVRELARLLGADNQTTIKEVFEQQQQAIQQHHQASGILSSRHNRQHTHSITEDVQVSQEDYQAWKHQRQTQRGVKMQDIDQTYQWQGFGNGCDYELCETPRNAGCQRLRDRSRNPHLDRTSAQFSGAVLDHAFI
jgi:hypothetical protein